MTSAVPQDPPPTSFWGTVELEPHSLAVGRLGRRRLYLRREAREWYIALGDASGDWSSGDVGWSVAEARQRPSDLEWTRTAFEECPPSVAVAPALPDRSLVVRPHTEVGVPPDQQVTLYVSAPLWIDVRVGDPAVSIFRRPLERTAETWFGESTRHGELCYAGRTVARLNFDRVTVPPGRALTEVRVRNLSRELLSFSRLRLPLPSLSLYRDGDGLLWTQPASLISEEGSLARLEIGDDAAWRAGRELVHGPAEPRDGNLLDRTFGMFFNRLDLRHDG